MREKNLKNTKPILFSSSTWTFWVNLTSLFGRHFLGELGGFADITSQSLPAMLIKGFLTTKCGVASPAVVGGLAMDSVEMRPYDFNRDQLGRSIRDDLLTSVEKQ